MRKLPLAGRSGQPQRSRGDDAGDVYDTWFGGMLDAVPAADRLAELAGPGPALELGIGTGRVALPLTERGVEIHGIDGSAATVN